MKVIALADLHGELPNISTPFDLMLICGDICPATNHSISYQEYWLKNNFNDWLKQLPYKDIFSRIVCIAGNHDFYFERLGEIKRQDLLSSLSSNFIYLEHELYSFEYQGAEGNLEYIDIFGTPYCTEFGNWAFMRESECLKNKFSQIPNNIDILISHDAPFGLNGLGSIQDGYNTGAECGSRELLVAIKRVQPKYFFCGHIHTGNHIVSYYKHESTNKYTLTANVSILDESYTQTYEPLIFDYLKTINYERKSTSK